MKLEQLAHLKNHSNENVYSFAVYLAGSYDFDFIWLLHESHENFYYRLEMQDLWDLLPHELDEAVETVYNILKKDSVITQDGIDDIIRRVEEREILGRVESISENGVITCIGD